MNSLTIVLNGKKEKISKINTLSELITLKKLDPKKIVAEINLQIIDRDKLHTTKINENDAIEIISFVGGG